jgi:hypothetical protein
LAVPRRRDNFTVDHRVVGQIAEGLDDVRVLSAKRLPFSGNEAQLAFKLIATARYPSSLISYTHSGPSGSFETERHSIGSMNAASRRRRESIVSIRNVVAVVPTYRGIIRVVSFR